MSSIVQSGFEKRRFWLALGALYGSMFGHAIGRIVVESRWTFRDYSLDEFSFAIGGLLAGVAISLLVEALFRMASSRHLNATLKSLTKIHSLLWMAFPVVLLIYVLVIPAIRMAR